MSIVQHPRQALYLPPGYSLPREQLATIQNVLNQALRASVPPPPPYKAITGEQCYKPRMDLWEASGAVTATFELPGLRKEDIHIDVVEGRMVVVGERRSDSPIPSQGEISDNNPRPPMEDGEIHLGENPASYTVREIKRGRFKRIVPLPSGTKLEDIKACMHDGILTVTYPGAPPPVVQSVPIS